MVVVVGEVEEETEVVEADGEVNRTDGVSLVYMLTVASDCSKHSWIFS